MTASNALNTATIKDRDDSPPLPKYALDYADRIETEFYQKFIDAMDRAVEAWKADEANHFLEEECTRLERTSVSYPSLKIERSDYDSCIHRDLKFQRNTSSIPTDNTEHRWRSSGGTHNGFKMVMQNCDRYWEPNRDTKGPYLQARSIVPFSSTEYPYRNEETVYDGSLELCENYEPTEDIYLNVISCLEFDYSSEFIALFNAEIIKEFPWLAQDMDFQEQPQPHSN